MTPYVDLLYFAVLLYPVVPAFVLGVIGRLRLWYVLAATVAMLLVQYGDPLGTGTAQGLTWLAAFTGFETAVVMAFALVRRHGRFAVPYYLAVAAVLLPLAAVKVYPLLAAHGWIGPVPALHTSAIGATAAPTLTSKPGPSPAISPKPSAAVTDTFGFLGISYLTFRFLDVVIGLQDGLYGTPGLATLLTYVLFFPCVSSGPIDRYRRFVADAAQTPRSAEYLMDVDAGIYRIAQGFLYKFIIAHQIYQWWIQPLSAARDPWHIVLYMYAYTFYLFFDFAGYSAFAIGTGRLFGIRTPENFNAPFLSRNFKDFWNRWFITLSWFLRDHVYMRFVLGATKRRWFRSRYTASYIGYLLTFGAMGFWHGLQAHYIVYGLYHGIMIICNDWLGRWNQRRKLLPDIPLTRGLSILLTFQLVCFGMLIFSGHLFR